MLGKVSNTEYWITLDVALCFCQYQSSSLKINGGMGLIMGPTSEFIFTMIRPACPAEGPYDIILSNQDTINFTCRAKTDPTTKLTYTWTHENTEISHGRIDTTIPGLVVINILNSENKAQEFIGTWTCIASNGISRATKEAKLLHPPGI